MESGALVARRPRDGDAEGALAEKDAAGGALFDGYPRTVPQAAALDGILAERRGKVGAVLFIDVPDAPIVERLVKRAALEGRADDTPETIRERLRVYREKTAPLADRYRKAGVLVTIDGHRDIETVFADVRTAVGSARKGAG